MDLTQNYIKEILDYDPNTGEFSWKKISPGRIKPGDIAGSKHKYYGKGYCRVTYSVIKIKGKTYLAHRLAFLYMLGKIPPEIDHIDGDGLNNSWDNLRVCSRQQNTANVGLQENNSSGYKGVCFDKARNKYLAGLKYNYKRYNLGRHDNPEDAARAYDRKAIELFGDFAWTNFPRSDYGDV